MKRILFLLILSHNISFASHFMGGEITWECIKSGPDAGKYVFEMKVYRDCNGIPFSQISQTLTHHNYPAVGQTTPILLNFISATDISPIGSLLSGNACFDCTQSQQGAVEEFIWRSDPMVLAGAPPPEGWHFTWGSSARSGAITNGMANLSWTLRAVMYSYTDASGTILPTANTCHDSSPEFKEQAKTIICTGYQFSYSHNASDSELDDLKYSWAEPLGTSGNYDPSNPNSIALAFTAPYSVNSPIPGNPSLDSLTGEITYLSNTSGVFVTCIKVEARKCGQLVAEIYREVQVVLLDCANFYQDIQDGFNDPPEISGAFVDPITGLPTYEKNVYAGELVQFNIEAEDFDVYSNNSTQDITLDASGGQFAPDYISTVNCANPPCATFTDGSGNPPPFTSNGVVSGVFEWQTTCDHMSATVGCNTTTNVFTFLIKASDDFCPANGISIATIKITVVPPIPDFRCVSVQENGHIDLTWEFAPGAPPTLEPYMIYRSDSPNGPFILIDSILFPNTTFTDTAVNGHLSSYSYFLSTEEGCGISSESLESDTLESIFMDAQPINLGVTANLNWNPIHDPLLLTSALDYELYYNGVGFTDSLLVTTPLLSFQKDADNCDYNPEFYVEIADISGCISRSSIGIVHLADTNTPITPIITDVSVNNDGHSAISWLSSPGADLYAIYKLDGSDWITIDTVLSTMPTEYVYSNSNASDFSETFCIRALDSCGNAKEKSLSHNSIYVSYDINSCSESVEFNWNEYINWDNGVSYYKITLEITDLNGTINIDSIIVQDTSSILDFTYYNLQDNYSYVIYIDAFNFDTTFIARSNKQFFNTDFQKRPEYNYIEQVTVNRETGFVEISCLVDNNAVIDRYDVMRSLRGFNNFQKIGEINANGATKIYYTDDIVSTSSESYEYKIYPIDTCNVQLFPPSINMSEYSNTDTSIGTTILLTAKINIDYSDSTFAEEYTNTLSFNDYREWLGGVTAYKLYRSVNRDPFNLLELYTWDRINFPDEPLDYIDIVTEFGEGNGRFCYYIHAIEGDTNPYGPSLFGSFSNIACVSQTPILFLPNTFTPNGDEHNEIFYPITFFVSEIGYHFGVFTRSGAEIFSTKNPKKGWDGTYKGNLVQNGTYIYHLQYLNGVGNLTEQTGVINLVR